MAEKNLLSLITNFKKYIMFDKSKIPEITISVTWDKKIKKSEMIHLKTSKELAQLCYEIFNKDTFDWVEEVIMILLNGANKVIGYRKISSGGMASTVLDARVVMLYAVQGLANSIVIAHNHPSGSVEPSRMDIETTKRLKEACGYLSIKLVDHIIVAGEDSYYSFANEGIL